MQSTLLQGSCCKEDYMPKTSQILQTGKGLRPREKILNLIMILSRFARACSTLMSTPL